MLLKYTNLCLKKPILSLLDAWGLKGLFWLFAMILNLDFRV